VTKQSLSQEASEAWQDVESEWSEREQMQIYAADSVDKARAADAQQLEWFQKRTTWYDQQIAALRAENEQAGNTMAASLALANQIIQELRDKKQAAEAQLTALQAENEQVRDELSLQQPSTHALNLAAQVRKLEAQLTALRAELNEIDSVLARRDALDRIVGRTNKILVTIAAAQSADPKAASAKAVVLTARNQELEAQLTEQAQWQPIETAPKDGTSILVWKQGEAVVQGWWNRGGAFNMPHWSTPSNLFDPTHWMPLLQPPLAALTAQQETPK